MGSSNDNMAFNYSDIYDVKGVRENENNSWFAEETDPSKKNQVHPLRHRSSILKEIQESHFPVSKLRIEI